jgi:molybdate/tungstate transport system substrate-binding protein
MRPVKRNVLTVVVVVIAVVAGFVGGWYARPTSSGGSSTTLGVIAAGSLSPSPLLPSLASAYANDTSGVSAPISAQLYEGSTAAATAIVSAGSDSPYDIFIAADFRVIPQHLIDVTPSYATGEAVFASDPIVLAYNPTAISGVNSTNWYEKIQAPGIDLGVPNASADPLGSNVIFTLELEDAAVGTHGLLYSHFFSGAQGGFAKPTRNTEYVPENGAGVALTQDEVQAYLIYESYAKAENLSYLTLSPLVNLGGFSASDVANYENASTTVLSGTSTKVVVGAPALFALTVPTNAPDPALGNAFAAWLLSNSTAPIWTADGFLLTPSIWVVGALAFLPAGMPDLPPYLAPLL